MSVKIANTALQSLRLQIQNLSKIFGLDKDWADLVVRPAIFNRVGFSARNPILNKTGGLWPEATTMLKRKARRAVALSGGWRK